MSLLAICLQKETSSRNLHKDPHTGAHLMGKVFTPADVSKGRVPELASFDHLVATYRKWLPRERWFTGGILAGSVLQRKHNRRSDIDLFIVFKGSEQAATTALCNFWEAHVQSLHVPVNINLWSVHNLKTASHSIGFGFLGHLAWAAEHEGLIGENPLKNIALASRHQVEEDLRSYLAKKIRRLREFACEDGRWTDARCRTLENIAAASLHASRRWLAIKGHREDDFRNKEDVMRHVGTHNARLERELRALVNVDAEYALALDQVLATKGRDRRHYVRALEALSVHAGEASTFLGKLFL